MRKFVLLFVLLLSFLTGFSQTLLPNGYPLTYSRQWVRYGYVQADSALIMAPRDTSWSPRFIGSTVYWLRPGIDSTLWTYNGTRWAQIVGASSPYTDTSKIRVYSSLAALRGAYPLDSTFIYRVVTNKKIISDFYFTADQSTADDSVMTFAVTGGRIKRFVQDEINALWFGATGDGSTDDYQALQKAINYCVYNDTSNSLFIPAGTYRITKGLLVWKDVNNDGVPEFTRVRIRGQALANGNSSQETIIYNTDTTSFGLGIQRGKGCIVKDIIFKGQNQLSYTLAQAWNESTSFVVAGRTNLQSPYAGIVLDPFGSSTTGTDRYPDFTNYYAGVAGTGGSTACTFNNIRIDGYVVGIILSPNTNTQNNEAHVFNEIWLANCREGFATTQSQERQVTVTNFRAWDDVKTVFDSYTYGLNRGEPPNINGVNVAGSVFQLFNFNGVGGYFPVISINNVYAESFYRIGTVIGQNVGFFNSHFALAMTPPEGMKVQDWVLTTNNATFNNCMLLYYNGAYASPLNIITSGVVKFTNCILSNQASTYYDQWTDNVPQIQYENVRFYTRNGAINGGSIVSNFSNYKSFSAAGTRFIDINDVNATYSYGQQYSGIPSYAYQVRKVKSQMRKWIPLGNVAITVSGNTATALIPSLAGKTQFQGLLVFNLLQTATGGMQMMRINTIDGSGNVTFNYVTERVTTGTYAIWIEDLQALATPYIFDYDGSTFSNVYQDASVSGPVTPSPATLSTSGTYYYNGKPVLLSSSSAGAATPTSGWVPYDNSIKRGVLSNYLYEESGESYGNPLTNSYFSNGIMFTENAFYSNTKNTGLDSLVVGYKVIRTGIKGSVVPPEFEVVYRKSYSTSYTSLRQTPFVTNGGQYTVQGNGGQIDAFTEDPSDKTSSDDSAMVIVNTSGNRLKRITNGVVNALWFGAVPDDGVDDSWAFQKMFNYLDTVTTLKNFEVFIPGGKYQMSGPVTLPASLYNAGSGSLPRLSIKGDGATIFVTGAITAWKRAVADMSAASTAIDNYTLSLSGIEFVGTQTTGQKGLELHALYGAELSNMRFTALDTGFVARFILGSKFENLFYTNNKSAGFVGASLSGVASGATTSNSAFNSNTITKNRYYCASGSYAAVMLYAADGTSFNDNIIEGFKPRYSFFYDSEGSSVVNGNSISRLWFEATGGTYTNNVAMKLRVNGVFNIDKIQNDYADTLIDWSNSTAGAVVTLDNVEYWNWPAKYIKGAPASGMNFKVGTVYGSVFENFFSSSYYNDGIPQDVASLHPYQLSGGAGIGGTIASTEISVKPSFGQAYASRIFKVSGNIVPDTMNTFNIGRPTGVYASGYFQNLYAGKTSQYGLGEAMTVAASSGVGIAFRDGMYGISDSSATSKILLGGTVNLFTGMYYNTNNWRVDANGATYYASGAFRARIYNNGNLRLGSTITDNGDVLQVDGTSWLNGKIKIFGHDSAAVTGGYLFRDYTTGEVKLGSIPNNNLYARNTGSLGSGIFTLVNDSTFGFKKIYGVNGVSVTESDSTVTLEVDAISDNTYTVSLTNVTNIASSSTNTTNYERTGDIVHVWGTFTVSATAGSSVCELGFSLPVSSSIVDEFQLGGTAASETGVACFIGGDTVNSRAKIRFTPPNTSSTKYSFHFTYKVILP